MSKLAHSNEETMLEIERRARARDKQAFSDEPPPATISSTVEKVPTPAAQQPQSDLVKRLRTWEIHEHSASEFKSLLLETADRIEALEAALEKIALLDEADGHELKADHAFEAVATATSTLGKHPSEIYAARTAPQKEA